MPIKTYASHEPSEVGRQLVAELRKAFTEVHMRVFGAVPDSRERAIALTHLEMAAMWAIKGVVHNDPDSEALPDLPSGPPTSV